MLPRKIAFIDIETTGGRSFYDRIIEIGILRVEDNKITRTYHSLIDPQANLPREIEILTGITSSDLENAPTFRAIKDDILDILEDCYFVAHNVRFDYGFIKSEFRRLNISFSSKHFCTVRLSRLLYPTSRHHNLDAIIERFNLTCPNRHRAFDDAKVLYDFYQNIQREFSQTQLEETISKTLKKPSAPLKLPYSALENLPESPGVYTFYSDSGMPLYIGKSKNLRNRILSHFSSDIHSPTEMNISQQVTSIETIKTAGELGALLLELRLIKKYLPLYNKRSRNKQELIAVKSRTNDAGYMETIIEPITTDIPSMIEANTDSFRNFHGFFKSRKTAKTYLTEISKKHSLCEKLLGLEKTKKDCFGYRLGQCKGACIGEEKPEIYNLKFIIAFTGNAIKPWPFTGPIFIKEMGLDGNKEYFLIDKWCYLGNMAIDEQDVKKDNFFEKPCFDLDTYKILRQFIRNPLNSKKIKLVRKEEVVLFPSGQEA